MIGTSVLTLVRNRTAHLLQLVEGLRRSTIRPLELIIVDMSDAPVDRPDAGFPIRLERLEGTALPLAKARNLAAAEAEGERLLFLDVDCIPGGRLIERMAITLLTEDALVCPEILYLGPGDARGSWQEMELQTAGRPHPVRPFPKKGLRTEPNPGLFWSTAFGCRASLFRRLGGFDEAFEGYGAEDTDLGFRAARAGVPLLFLGGAPAFHQHHDVYDPPLQHFDALIRNARLFHARWGIWPMDGWLHHMQRLGLIALSKQGLEIVRPPRLEEIEDAKALD